MHATESAHGVRLDGVEKIRTMRPYPPDMLRRSAARSSLVRRNLVRGAGAGPGAAAGRVETAHGQVVAEAQSVRRPLAPGSDILVGDMAITAASPRRHEARHRHGGESGCRDAAAHRSAGGQRRRHLRARGRRRADPRPEADRKEVLQLRSLFGLIVALARSSSPAPATACSACCVARRGHAHRCQPDRRTAHRPGLDIRKPGHFPSAPRRGAPTASPPRWPRSATHNCGGWDANALLQSDLGERLVSGAPTPGRSKNRSIASLNSRWKLSSARRCKNTAPSPIAARSMNTNSRGTVTGPFCLQRAVHPEGLAAAVFRGLDPVGDGAHPVIEQRPIDEPRPDVERCR